MNKRIVFLLWVLVILTAFYFYFFQNDLVRLGVSWLMSRPLSWRYAVFLILGCLRGFTLIPVTYIIFLGLIFLPALPAYILIMVGVMVSSACIYYFAEYLGLANYFERRYSRQIAQLRLVLKKNELPIVISWSFFPFTPTDLMCYMCGSLRVNIRKFLLGVFIGESISCAIYVFVGKDVILFVIYKLLGV